MLFDEFITDISSRLKGRLPGVKAQKLMAPLNADHNRFRQVSKADARLGAVLILLYPEDDQIFFPLIRRPKYIGVHSGQVALPGGGKEAQDVDLVATAIRETEEEIGIPSTDLEIIGKLSSLYIPVSNYKVLPVVGYTTFRPKFIPDRHEVDEVISVPIAMIREAPIGKMTDVILPNGTSIGAPHFSYDNHIVWGATAMMLSEFRAVLTAS